MKPLKKQEISQEVFDLYDYYKSSAKRGLI